MADFHRAVSQLIALKIKYNFLETSTGYCILFLGGWDMGFLFPGCATDVNDSTKRANDAHAAHGSVVTDILRH